MQDTLQGLNAVFRKVFRNPDLSVTGNTTAADIPRWDSLTHMHLVAEVEKHFGIVITFDEAGSFANVGELAALILKKKRQ